MIFYIFGGLGERWCSPEPFSFFFYNFIIYIYIYIIQNKIYQFFEI